MDAETEAPDAGAPEFETELDWRILKTAVEIVEDWEAEGADSAAFLVRSLHKLFFRVKQQK